MKIYKIFLFFIAVFALMFACWYLVPAEGVEVGGVKLRFPSYEAALEDLRNGNQTVDVDSVLLAVQQSYEMVREQGDTLDFYKEYLTSNPNRIHLPDDDYTFFDSFFAGLDTAAASGQLVRIVHYGDSQLEMDRISSMLRQQLQERFGGSGPGMVPILKPMSSVSVTQNTTGSLTRYALVADTLSRWSSTHRYGPLTRYAVLTGEARFNFKRAENRYAQERVRGISKVSVLFGHNAPGLKMSLKCDTLSLMTESVDSAVNGVSVVSWDLPYSVKGGTLSLNGTAEIYGIMLDGGPGVTVDNVAMRGCSGTILSGIDSVSLRESYEKTDTRLIILQFGGNAMPGIGSKKAISIYMDKLEKQFDYFKKVAPWAKLMFVGPADMSKSVNGSLVTWPLLPELNDSLKVHCLNNGIAYWDTFNMMGGVGSMREWVNHNPQLAGPDYIHFTTRGAAEVGSALAKSLLLYDDFRHLRLTLSDQAVREYMDSLTDKTPVAQIDSSLRPSTGSGHSSE
ncbi:MAG: hypothetical protein J5886_04215 [Bacteroidales bacterium]|nr:hypothetical protein [Bacteroidales bacterium]